MARSWPCDANAPASRSSSSNARSSRCGPSLRRLRREVLRPRLRAARASISLASTPGDLRRRSARSPRRSRPRDRRERAARAPLRARRRTRAARRDDREPRARELLVVDREQLVRRARGAIAPCPCHAQHRVALLQHLLVVLHASRGSRARRLNTARSRNRRRSPGAPRGSAEVLGREHDDVEAAEVARQRPRRLAVERDLAPPPGASVDLVDAHQLVLDDARAELAPRARRTRSGRRASPCETTGAPRRVDRLEQVRLALPVVADEDVEPLARLELQRLAGCARPRRRAPRSARSSDPHRHDDAEIVIAAERLDEPGSSSPPSDERDLVARHLAEQLDDVLRVEADRDRRRRCTRPRAPREPRRGPGCRS